MMEEGRYLEELDRKPVKGFKAMHQDMCCRPSTLFEGMHYKVGRVYCLPDGQEPVLCKRGFHFCMELFDCYRHYRSSLFTRICEVEALGKVIEQSSLPAFGGKCVTNCIRIVRELSVGQIINQLSAERGSLTRTQEEDRLISRVLLALNYELDDESLRAEAERIRKESDYDDKA